AGLDAREDLGMGRRAADDLDDGLLVGADALDDHLLAGLREDTASALLVEEPNVAALGVEVALVAGDDELIGIHQSATVLDAGVAVGRLRAHEAEAGAQFEVGDLAALPD